MDLDDLIGFSEKLKMEVSKLNKDCLSLFSVETYIGYINRYPRISSYDYVKVLKQAPFSKSAPAVDVKVVVT